MGNWLKKLIRISLVTVLLAACLTGCGGKKEEETETEAPESSPAASEELDAKVGQVVSLKSGALIIETDDGKTLEFDVSGVNKVNREAILEGNTVAVVYSGILSGTDTDAVTVELVIAMDADNASGGGVTGSLSTGRSQMSGTVVEYIEGAKLVIESSADGEYYYFSVEDAVISDSADIEEGDTVTVAYTGDIQGDDLVPADRITVSNSGSSSSGGVSSSGVSGSSSSGDASTSGASGNSFASDTIRGTVVTASMNTVTIRTSGGTRYTFSTIDAEMGSVDSLEEGMSVTLYYTGDLSEGAETVTVTSVEVN